MLVGIGCGHPADRIAAPRPAPVRCELTVDATRWRPQILDGKAFLPDFSFAGAHWGDPPPALANAREIRVTELGARADDDEDDTPALQEALRRAHALPAATPVVIVLPAGTLILRDILWIRRGNLVLRGDAANTRFLIDRSLGELPIPDHIAKHAQAMAGSKTREGAPFSPYSWRGGFIWAHLPTPCPKELVATELRGRRGDHTIHGRLQKVAPGDVVVVKWFLDPAQTLIEHVLGGEHVDVGPKAVPSTPDVPLVEQPVTVVEVRPDGFRTREPLLHDLRAEWNPRATRSCHLDGIRLEHLELEFPDNKYAGHHLESGYNAIALEDVRHSWVSDVSVINADSGFIVGHSSQLTLERIRTNGRDGHYSASVSGSYGVLVKDFQFAARARHNPSFGSAAIGCVFTRGSVIEPRLDQHMSLNHQNLFDDIQGVSISRQGAKFLFAHGGNPDYRPTAAAYNVFWNITLTVIGDASSKPLTLSPIKDAPQARIVGLTASTAIDLEYGPAAHIEGTNRGRVSPPSLYEYQRCMRAATPQITPRGAGGSRAGD